MGGGTTLTLWTLLKAGICGCSFFKRTSSISDCLRAAAKFFLTLLAALVLLFEFLPFLAVVAELFGDRCNLKDSAKF